MKLVGTILTITIFTCVLISSLTIAVHANQSLQVTQKKTEPLPIEIELNQVIKKSFDRARKPKSRYSFGKIKTTRITITHKLSAPIAPEDKTNQEVILRKLRISLYSQVSDECNTLTELFNKSCHLSTIKITPQNNYYNQRSEQFLLKAVVTYILSEKK